MNVDIENYSEILGLIENESLIQRCELISFDLEFGGLKFENNERDRSQLFPFQKYQKMAAVVRKYSIIQLGITFFIPDQQNLKAYPFNFFVFPRPSIYLEPSVSLQSGCVSFNITNKMDWNRWIEKGITYMKLTDYQKIIEKQQNGKTFTQLMEYLDEENKLMVSEMVDNLDTQTSYSLSSSSYFYVKKAVQKYFQEKKKLYAVKRLMSDVQEDMIEFSLVKITQKEKQQIEAKKQEQLFGFTLLFEKIWNSGKPFVGHNCMFDILFMYNSFIAALPYDYQFFKKQLTGLNENQQIARKFFDTKHIANTINDVTNLLEDSTTLENLYNLIRQKNFQKQIIELDPKFNRYELKNQLLHEAGFDSYLTGWLFYQLKNLCVQENIHFGQFAGKINLNRSYFYSNLNQYCDGLCSYVRVFYIQIAAPNAYTSLDVLRDKKTKTLKQLRDIFKRQNLLKQIILHEGLKQVFIDIKTKQLYAKVTQTLIKAVEKKQISQKLYSLFRYIQGRKAKALVEGEAK